MSGMDRQPSSADARPSVSTMRGIDHDETVLVHVHDRYSARDPNLVGRQADALRGIHGLEHVVNHAPYVFIYRRHRLAMLPQHR